jgi:hypothetical protein
VFVFLAWALAFFLGGDLVAGWLFPGSEWGAVGVLGGVVVLWYFGFGWLSRRCELEADLYSFELLRDPEAMMTALQRVGGRLRDIASWRHFSTNDRLGFMHKVATDPSFAPRFRRARRIWAWTGIVLALVAVGLQVRELARGLPRDRAVVDLARGRYAAARARLERTAGADPELLDLARDGEALAGDRAVLVVDELEDELRDALDAGDLRRASLACELLIYRDRYEFAHVADAIEALADSGGEGALLRPDLIDEPWRELLMRLARDQ